MKAVIQCVTDASVEISGEVVGEIERGLCVLLGVAEGDDEDDASWMARKLAKLRVFPDSEGRTNCDLQDVDGAVLLVSQFTLLGDCAKGNRPSFIKAADPENANALYESVAKRLKMDHSVAVETGRFGEQMTVRLSNQGPFTVLLDSSER
jgi:D-tyrosyl-tRNA(Tyr) deacylase